MAERYQRQHALSHLALEARAAAAARRDGAVRLWLQPDSVQLCLRGDAGGAFAAAVQSVLGVVPPTMPGTAACAGATRILWLGPDEWLAVSESGEPGALIADLERALAGGHALVSDVSHSRCILGLAGPCARQVLMKGCGLDLDPVVFAAGQCAQSALARAHMLLHQTSDAPSYHLYTHRSFADYVFRWLEDAASEYGLVPCAAAP
jgi:sarcosine oxidase subunit gamma